MSHPELISARELSKRLKKSYGTVLRWKRDELIPFQQPTRCTIWFVEADVRKAIANFNKPRN